MSRASRRATIGTERHLTVTDELGEIVAEVDTPSDFRPGPDGSCVTPVIGHFEPGPGFSRIRALLDEFGRFYEAGNLTRATALHEDLDRLVLRAIDSDGRMYRVSVIYFQQGGLLFTATAP